MATIGQDMRDVVNRAMLSFVATVCEDGIKAAGLTPDDLASGEWRSR